MKISIALATYNGEKYLKEQLKSYISQKRLPDELIICDDVSNDGTIEILEEFKKTAPFKVNIIENETNLGYTKNFEKALSLCSGDIVFFSDQDDVWLPDKISKIETVFKNNPDISLVIHNGELVNENLESTGLTKLGQIVSGGHNEDSFATGTLTAVRRDIINIILPFPEGIAGGHDGWVHAIAKMLNRRLVTKEVLQLLRRHSNNTSEWIISSTKKINKIDVFKSQLATKVATSYKDRLHINENLILRFNKVSSNDYNHSFLIDLNKIEKILQKEHKALMNREELISQNFLGRKLKAISMLIAQDYKYFNGIKSFFRDFLR